MLVTNISETFGMCTQKGFAATDLEYVLILNTPVTGIASYAWKNLEKKTK